MDLERFGWAWFGSSYPLNHSYGRIASAIRDRYIVWTAEGERNATVSGRLTERAGARPVVGDWVALRPPGIVEEILTRRTQLVRKEPGSGMGEQVLAANIDVAFIVSGLDADYNPRRLERYLIAVQRSGARPTVLLNKADLHADATPFLKEVRTLSAASEVFAISAHTGQGFDLLEKSMKPNQTAALLGSSGAGKSTILNRLFGAHRQQTSEVRANDSKGRHTTVRRELILMPQGWLLMDLPGLRELQLAATTEHLDDAFADITELAGQCRFGNCTHTQEPGCALRVSSVDPARLASYRKLEREILHYERETNRQAREKYKRFVKNTEKSLRQRNRFRERE